MPLIDKYTVGLHVREKCNVHVVRGEFTTQVAVRSYGPSILGRCT